MVVPERNSKTEPIATSASRANRTERTRGGVQDATGTPARTPGHSIGLSIVRAGAPLAATGPCAAQNNPLETGLMIFRAAEKTSAQASLDAAIFLRRRVRPRPLPVQSAKAVWSAGPRWIAPRRRCPACAGLRAVDRASDPQTDGLMEDNSRPARRTVFGPRFCRCGVQRFIA